MMATVQQDDAVLRIETDSYHAAVQTEGYVSGVMAGSFVDKRTGARDLSFGLCIADFLLEPGVDDESTPPALRYHWGDTVHGQIPKRYVELPQICTQAKKLPFEVVEGKDFVAVRQWFTWTTARPPYPSAGSRWEQWLVFPDGTRWFFAYDKVTSSNTVNSLLLRMDMPGHIKHQSGDTFEKIHLSYHGDIPSQAFSENFPPDRRYLYQRGQSSEIPQRFIRAYQLSSGVWLAGMTLEPSAVYEAWCHQRGYVCMIQEIGGWCVRKGESFGAVHLVGFFDDHAEMQQAFDRHRGSVALRVEDGGWFLER